MRVNEIACSGKGDLEQAKRIAREAGASETAIKRMVDSE